MLVIRGLAEDVQLAQVLIHKAVASQPRTETRILEVRSTAVGRLIGRGGETIRSMQARSRCRINVERSSDASE